MPNHNLSLQWNRSGHARSVVKYKFLFGLFDMYIAFIILDVYWRVLGTIEAFIKLKHTLINDTAVSVKSSII